MPHLFCFGLGYSARVLCRRLLSDGWSVSGTSRSEEGCQRLRQMGVSAHRFDGTQALDAAVFETVTHVLGSAPPEDEGDGALRWHADALTALGQEGQIVWTGYLSTTGVYGDHQGGWVDEDTPPAPDLGRSRRRLMAERQWQGLCPSAHIFRLAGIYGPGRNPLLQVQAGKARCIIKENQWFCRIHVDDIASVVEASIRKPDAGRIYNVCDDLPAPPQDPIRFAASLLKAPAPPEIPFDQADLSPMAKTFYADSRRVRNNRLKEELGVRLAYPSYKEGLQTLYKDLP